jgi:hypothetical protein
VKKLAKRHERIGLAYRLESLASRIELKGAAVQKPDIPALTEQEMRTLESHADPGVALTTQLVHKGTFRLSDVRAIKKAHVRESSRAFLITIFGGKNHRRLSRVGKVQWRKKDLSKGLVRHLHQISLGKETISSLPTAAYNDIVSEALGRRVTSRNVRQTAIDEVLLDSLDPESGATDYRAAASRTHHWSCNTLKAYYHRHPVE